MFCTRRKAITLSKSIGPRFTTHAFEVDVPRTIEQQIHATYLYLRVSAAAIAFVFPLLLLFGGWQTGIPLRGSMSDYYWATHNQACPCDEQGVFVCSKPTLTTSDDLPDPNLTLPPGTFRSWFVGFLFAIGVILIVNQGHSRWENYCLSLAGCLAWGIAIFPERWDCYEHKWSKHGVCAMAFFFCIAVVSGVFSKNTLNLIHDKETRDRYHLTYNVLAGLMAASPVLAFIFNALGKGGHFIYWAEFCGIWAFAGYWCVKTREMSGPDAERRAIEKLPKSAPPLVPGTSV